MWQTEADLPEVVLARQVNWPTHRTRYTAGATAAIRIREDREHVINFEQRNTRSSWRHRSARTGTGRTGAGQVWDSMARDDAAKSFGTGNGRGLANATCFTPRLPEVSASRSPDPRSGTRPFRPGLSTRDPSTQQTTSGCEYFFLHQLPQPATLAALAVRTPATCARSSPRVEDVGVGTERIHRRKSGAPGVLR